MDKAVCGQFAGSLQGENRGTIEAEQKEVQHPLKGAALFVYPHCSAMAFAIPGKVLLLAFAVRGSFHGKIFPFSSVA